jgi:predicted DNA-binding transcriptional regulator YafY
MDTTVRTLALLNLIPVFPKKVSVKQLQEKLIDLDPEFEVTDRTIMRDLNALALTFQLVCDRHRPQGWSKLKTEEIASLKMDIKTARAFREVEKLLEKKIDRNVLDALAPFFKQASVMVKGADSGIGYKILQENQKGQKESPRELDNRYFKIAA